MIKKLTNYIDDKSFKMIYYNNAINIVNYQRILEIKNDVITIEKENKILFIRGNNLKINKLLDHEILITGSIQKIDL